jgi:hypothetical protein
MNSKNYWYDGKLHSTTLKITEKWIYSKSGCWHNTFGTVYKTPKGAIKAFLKDQLYYKNALLQNINEINVKIRKRDKSIRKAEKLLTKMSS